MKLELHLIPQTSFYLNLREFLGTRWNILSKNIRTYNDFTCQYCNAKKEPKNIHLHEVWKFYTEEKIQKLVGFECLCNVCHSVHHWGCSQIKGLNMDFLAKHACSINDCSLDEWNLYVIECFNEWQERSLIKWNIDISYINNFRLELI